MKSFLHGKKSVPVNALRVPARTPPSVTAGSMANALAGIPVADSRCASASSANGDTSIEVVKDGDKVIRMIVTCGCGERIEIDCLYALGG